MPSGVRVTIALVVVVFVGIGLYYASLENSLAPAVTTADGGLVRQDEQPTEESVKAPKTDDTPNAANAPSTQVPPSSSDPVSSDPPAVAKVGVASSDLQGTAAPESKHDPVAIDTETQNQSGQRADTESPAEGIQAPQDPEETAPNTDQLLAQVSKGVPAKGAGVYLLADPFMSGVDREAIVSDFTKSGSLQGPSGTAWVRISDWISVPAGEPLPWIVAKRDGDTWLLVRDDEEGSLDLRGHVVAASERLDTLLGQPLVMFVLDDEATPRLRDLTYPNIGHDFAVVVDRQAVAVQIIRTAIEARATIAPSCSQENARWITARIRGDESERPDELSGPDEGESSDEVASGSVETGTTIQKTPPEAYGSWVVSEGDTFTSIAEEWFGDSSKWTLIAKANPLADPGRLRLGQKLRLPPKDTQMSVEVTEGVHVVSSGETLSDIAFAYYGNAKYWQNIYDANRTLIGDDPAVLSAGIRLTMPKIDS